jgi:hypothetical protein
MSKPKAKPKANPKQVPLGSGLLGKAGGALKGRKAQVDEQIEGRYKKK